MVVAARTHPTRVRAVGLRVGAGAACFQKLTCEPASEVAYIVTKALWLLPTPFEATVVDHQGPSRIEQIVGVRIPVEHGLRTGKQGGGERRHAVLLIEHGGQVADVELARTLVLWTRSGFAANLSMPRPLRCDSVEPPARLKGTRPAKPGPLAAPHPAPAARSPLRRNSSDDVRGPVVHQDPPPVEQVAAPVGGFDTVGVDVG